MSLVLTSLEIQRIGQIMRLLVSPGAHPTVDAWRHAVTEAVKELLGVDSVGFLLPSIGRSAMLSLDDDPEQLRRYPDTPAPDLSDGASIFQVMSDMRVGRLADSYGAEYRRVYLDSAYYNDYAGPNGAHHCTFIAAPLLDGDAQASMASLQLWRASRRSQMFRHRDVDILRLLLPAFEAGVKAYAEAACDSAGRLLALDSLVAAVALFDEAGREIHRSGRLTSLLASDLAGAGALHAAVLHTASVLLDVRLGAAVGDRALGRPILSEVRTTRDVYRVSGTITEGPFGDPRTTVTVTVEPLRASPQADLLRERYGLTPAESRVALLLREGRSNAEIASAVGISPHTSRRHTEAILSKLGVRSRAEVAATLV